MASAPTLINSVEVSEITASKITAGTIGAHEIILTQPGTQTSYTPPSSTAVLRSSNYSAGTAGWLIRGDGLAEFNDLTVRSRLDIGGDDASSFHVDNDGNMWLGAGILNYSTAPFRVSNTGALVATNANVSGAITASSGSFTGTITSGVNLTTQFGNNINGTANYSGFKIGNTGWENAWVQRSDGSIYFNAQSRNVAPDGTARGVSRLYIDDNNALISFNNGTFSVDYDGAMVASNANITGTVSAGSGNIAGINFSLGRLYSGLNGNWANANTGFYLDSSGYFSLKDRFFWNPATNVATFRGTLEGASGSIGADFIIGKRLRVGESTTTVDTNTILRVQADGTSSSTRYPFVVEKSNGSNIFEVREDGVVRVRAGDLYVDGTIIVTSGSNVNGMQVNRSYAAGANFIQFVNSTSGSAIGAVEFNGPSNVNFKTSSDIRLKENITNLENALNIIKLVNPVKFNFINDDTIMHGFIAQELYESYSIPVAVGSDDAKNNPWGIDYSKMTPLLTAAIKELLARVEELESHLI